MVTVSRDKRSRGLALIELVVAILLIALLAGAFYGLWRKGKDKENKSIPAQAVDRAKDTECKTMLQQVRAGILMAASENDDRPPPTIPSDVAPYAKCPQTGQPYAYDPQTGRVWCQTPGHEGF